MTEFKASLTTENWTNKKGTEDRKCRCGSWKNHWLNFTKLDWPSTCSVSGCNNTPTIRAHIYKEVETGEWIEPFSITCNQLTRKFDLKENIDFASANKSMTCNL